MIKRITAGECLKEILEQKLNEEFVPFNEAMCEGTYHAPLFSDEFILERAKTHSVTIDEYKKKLSGFLNILSTIDNYEEIHLYFGDDEFCKINRKIVVETLYFYGFKGKIISNVVNEYTGDIIYSEIL